MVVLPELFNCGYAYSQRNFALAESFADETVTWLRAQAAGHGVHLAASLLLRDGDEVFNAALLFAPDGRWWRYDKQYPYVWERVYFREGHGVTVADTELGRLGLMICWDSAHADVWARYVGQVDALVIMSCPPAYDRLDLVFPDGMRLNTRELNSLSDRSVSRRFSVLISNDARPGSACRLSKAAAAVVSSGRMFQPPLHRWHCIWRFAQAYGDAYATRSASGWKAAFSVRRR